MAAIVQFPVVSHSSSAVNYEGGGWGNNLYNGVNMNNIQQTLSQTRLTWT